MTKKISVVIVVLEGGDYLERSLTALSHQQEKEIIEVIVPCDDRIASTITLLQQNFPEIRFLKMSGRRTYAELRSAGFQNAAAPIVALTEDQCIPEPDWCSSILRAHETSHAAIGGAVDKYSTPTESLLNWSVYFCDYSRYANPVSEGVVRHLTDCNVTYKREALLSVANIWQPEFHETVVHSALQHQGKELWLSSHIVVKQQRNMSLTQALRERFAFGRLFGSTRVAHESVLRRMLFAVLSIALPVLLTVRIAKNVLEKKRYRSEFMRCLPLICLLNLVWASGELVGYVTASADRSLTPREAPV